MDNIQQAAVNSIMVLERIARLKSVHDRCMAKVESRSPQEQREYARSSEVRIIQPARETISCEE